MQCEVYKNIILRHKNVTTYKYCEIQILSGKIFVADCSHFQPAQYLCYFCLLTILIIPVANRTRVRTIGTDTIYHKISQNITTYNKILKTITKYHYMSNKLFAKELFSVFIKRLKNNKQNDYHATFRKILK